MRIGTDLSKPQPEKKSMDAAEINGVPSSLLLLNLQVEISSTNSHNATTASCKASGSNSYVHLTLCASRPPRISYLRLYCSGSLSASEPYIVATEFNTVLIAISFGSRYDYFVYKLLPPEDEKGASSLELLPEPVPSSLDDSHVGLMLCPGNHFLVAVLCYTSSPGLYTLHIYRSSTGQWKTIPSLSNKHQEHLKYYHANNKVIAVGGQNGTMAFVDLWHGILLCDLLPENSELRYIALPQPLEPTKELEGCPKSTRDIAVVDGRINYFELQIRVIPDLSSQGSYRSDGFIAAKWSISISGTDTWQEDYKFDASQISVDGQQVVESQFLSELTEEDGDYRQTLLRLHTGHPTLSLKEDHLVYIMAKVHFMDDKAWVLAIDMRNKVIQEVAQFIADRVPGFCYTYTHMTMTCLLHCTISSDKVT